MLTVRFTLTTWHVDAQQPSSKGRLTETAADRRTWLRDFRLDALPRPGDHILIAASAENPDGTIGADIIWIYWTFQGEVRAVLSGYHVDVDYPVPDGDRLWRSDLDGDLIGQLVASGWQTWDDYHHAAAG